MAEDRRSTEFTEYLTNRATWLRKVAYLLSGDWHRADDLVQTTMVKLYVGWPRFSQLDNIDGYVRTILVNTFLAEQRSPWYRRAGPHSSAVDRPAPAGDLDAALDLRAALVSLPARQRATIVLRYYCDLPVEEVAEVLRCSTGTVKSQTARAIERLRGVLTPRAVTPFLGSKL
jgi:RNA polymerase sigma-70 factor (sigma-E family)